MADIFKRVDVVRVLGKSAENRQGKSILMIGDSIMRCMYKDIVHLLNEENKNSLTDVDFFRKKWDDQYHGQKFSYQGDRLLNISYGNRPQLAYREERDFYQPESDIQISYVFITRCYSEYLVKFIDEYPIKFGAYPDLILMNSALFDINRYGGKGISKYKENIKLLMDFFRTTLPARTQVVWMTTPPISSNIMGADTTYSWFGLHHLKDVQGPPMRFNVMEGNVCAANAAAVAGFDVLDLHYHCRNIVFRRAQDGIHWNPDAVRFQTNLWLTHYCTSQKLDHLLPSRWREPRNMHSTNVNLDQTKELMATADNDLNPLINKPNQYPHKRTYRRAKRHLEEEHQRREAERRGETFEPQPFQQTSPPSQF